MSKGSEVNRELKRYIKSNRIINSILVGKMSCQTAEDELAEVKGNLTILVQQIQEQLLLDQERLSSEIEEFEPRIEELTMSIMKLKDMYDNLVAEYSEFERIKKGIEDEGVVDINDFNAVVQQKTDEGNALIHWSENTFNLLLEDIETLQAKVEKKRKAGA